MATMTNKSPVSDSGAAKSDSVDLFVMSGQSNMLGQSEAVATLSVPEEAGWEYRQARPVDCSAASGG
mgnify:CR=1 FL=1